MDPAHTTFLHKQSIGNPAATNVPVQVKRDDRSITAFRWLDKTPPSPFDKLSHDFGDALVDRLQSFSFELPCTSFVEICSMPAGLEKSEENMNLGLRSFSYKFLTPEDERSTHLTIVVPQEACEAANKWFAHVAPELARSQISSSPTQKEIVL